MAVTDLIVHPGDGSVYFAVGGRKTLSALYRLRYAGKESTAPAKVEESADVLAARKLRRELEAYHAQPTAAAIAPAVAQLGNADRSIRFAARIALEHLPVEKWREAALKVSEPQAVITAAIALSRSGSKADQAALLAKLSAIDFDSLAPAIQLELLRADELVFLRLAKADESQRTALLKQLDNKFPTRNALVNRELANVLVVLNAPQIVDRVVKELRTASAQEDQIHYAFCLREVEQGWTEELRKRYFEWFFETSSQRGGASFGGFLPIFAQWLSTNWMIRPS